MHFIHMYMHAYVQACLHTRIEKSRIILTNYVFSFLPFTNIDASFISHSDISIKIIKYLFYTYVLNSSHSIHTLQI